MMFARQWSMMYQPVAVPHVKVGGVGGGGHCLNIPWKDYWKWNGGSGWGKSIEHHLPKNQKLKVEGGICGGDNMHIQEFDYEEVQEDKIFRRTISYSSKNTFGVEVIV